MKIIYLTAQVLNKNHTNKNKTSVKVENLVSYVKKVTLKT